MHHVKHHSQRLIESAKQTDEQRKPSEAASESSPGSGLTDAHVRRLWERMAMIYGHKWTSQYGEQDDGTWLLGLSDVRPEAIRDGLEACIKSDDEWPPGVPEFRRMCLGKPKGGKNEFGLDYVPEYYRPRVTDRSRLLSSDDREARREKAREIFRQMREGAEG